MNATLAFLRLSGGDFDEEPEKIENREEEGEYHDKDRNRSVNSIGCKITK